MCKLFTQGHQRRAPRPALSVADMLVSSVMCGASGGTVYTQCMDLTNSFGISLRQSVTRVGIWPRFMISHSYRKTILKDKAHASSEQGAT